MTIGRINGEVGIKGAIGRNVGASGTQCNSANGNVDRHYTCFDTLNLYCCLMVVYV